jgi:hypothetical protein
MTAPKTAEAVINTMGDAFFLVAFLITRLNATITKSIISPL